MAGLYIHIPFCARKCIYCDFYSVGVKNAPWQDYLDALIAEMRCRKDELTECVDTIYIGGGTPSLMPAQMLISLVDKIKETMGEKWQPREFTIEVNPDDVTDSLVATLHRIGVNRVSMGVQSFIDSELKAIGRRHSVEQVEVACSLLRSFSNISMDLIFGLPGQTIDSWQYSLERMISLRPQHISAYSLMYEEGTTLYLMRQQGRLEETDDEVSLKMFRMLTERLRDAGYEQYEISNFAIPGYESRHNSSYWAGVQYLGLGPSAHSFDGRDTRRANPSSIRDYINRFRNQSEVPFYEEEHLSDDDLYNEYIMTRLRTMRGIDISELTERFSEKRLAHFMSQCCRHQNQGNLIREGNRVHLSEKGVLISDAVFVDLMM